MPPAKLVYPLERAYTPAEIAFDTLKGAAAKAECDLHLALLTIEQSGSAEFVDRGGSRRGRWREPEADDFEMGEIFEGRQVLSEWRPPDGTPAALGEMPVDDGEFSPSNAVETMEPDENHFHEATGNEGATLDRAYRRAALVLWPRDGFLAMIASAGLPVSVPYLGDLVAKWEASAGPDERARRENDARELAAAMIEGWPRPEHHYPGSSAPTAASALLRGLATLGAADLITRFLHDDGALKSRGEADNSAVIEALSRLAPAERLDTIGKIIGMSGAEDFGGCANLLARAARAWNGLNASELNIAARRLMVHRPPHEAPDRFGRRRKPEPSVVADIFTALAPIDADLAERTLDAMLADAQTYPTDEMLIPALTMLLRDGGVSAAPAVSRLRAACLAHLSARIAFPLEPPADYRRDAALTCKCTNCAPLAVFLADPKLPKWAMQAKEADRKHVEFRIRNSNCDAVTTTERKGSPHTLIVTKTQASYERRVKQRRDDIAMVKRIDAAPT